MLICKFWCLTSLVNHIETGVVDASMWHEYSARIGLWCLEQNKVLFNESSHLIAHPDKIKNQILHEMSYICENMTGVGQTPVPLNKKRKGLEATNTSCSRQENINRWISMRERERENHFHECKQVDFHKLAWYTPEARKVLLL